MKLNKISIVSLAQIIIVIISFAVGFNFKSESAVLSSTVLGMLTKVQTTDDFQNFVWLFTHNLTLMFTFFWVSYFSFGVVGTAWCISNAFMVGVLTNLYLIIIENPLLSILFMLLEFAAAIIVTISSTYFRMAKFQFKKELNNNSSEYAIRKKKHEKNILITFAVVAAFLFVAALIETIVLSSL